MAALSPRRCPSPLHPPVFSLQPPIISHLAFVFLFPFISEDTPDDLACVLYHHLTSRNVALTKQTTSVNGRPETRSQGQVKVKSRSSQGFHSKNTETMFTSDENE